MLRVRATTVATQPFYRYCADNTWRLFGPQWQEIDPALVTAKMRKCCYLEFDESPAVVEQEVVVIQAPAPVVFADAQERVEPQEPEHGPESEPTPEPESDPTPEPVVMKRGPGRPRKERFHKNKK
jgi:hypothetical protein